MRWLCLLASCALCAADVQLDGIVTLASQHWQQNPRNPYRMQQINPGAGLTVGLVTGTMCTPIVAAVAYRDSYGKAAAMGLVGMRYRLASWCDASIGMGWAHTGTYDGPALVPAIGFGTERCKLELSMISCYATGLSLRVRL